MRNLKKAVFGALLLVAGVAIGGASEGKATTSAGFEALYPVTAPPSATIVAGVDVNAIFVPGLTLKERIDETMDDGGVALTYADAQGNVRAVVRLVVAPTSSDARLFLRRELHVVARVLPEMTHPSLGDLVYGDDGVGQVFVAGTIANVGYVVRTIPDPGKPGSVPTAKSIALDLRSKTVAGTPTFPTPSVSVPSTFTAKTGAPITVVASTAQTPHLRGENAYIAHASSGPVVMPFDKGKVAVIALVGDELGRVGVARAEATAL